MPGASGFFELLGYGEEEIFFVGTGDQLDVDGESFGRLSHGKREAGKAGRIQPLGETHGVAIIVRIAGPVVAGAVFESWCHRNCGEQYWDFPELPEK